MTPTATPGEGILTIPRRVYSYLRVSHANQLKGDGMRRQAEFTTQHCTEEGWCLDDTLRFEDRGRSDYHGDN